ncbi:MAG: DUF4231 domain-containing protein [Luteimonas sp.]
MSHTDTRARLNVGLTAHRDLLPGEEPALRAAVRAFFLNLREQFPELPLRLISALAEGGDQLVAEEALALGIELMVPLPMAQAEYERDFSDPAVLRRFQTILAKAVVRVLPLAPGISSEAVAVRGEIRNRQYAQLGMFVSSHCQLLLALWDGNSNGAMGGTAQVVEFHLHDTMPNLSLDQIAPNLLADDESDLIFHISCSRRLGAPGMPPRLPPLHTRWVTQTDEHDASGGIPEHYVHVFRQLEMFNADLHRHASEIETDLSTLLTAPLPGAPSQNVATIERRFHAADWLAIHFQRRVRVSLLCTHVIAALMGMAFILYSDATPLRIYLAAFLGLFLLGWLLTIIGQRRQWQRKYLDYRGLAEGLRVELYWRIGGVEIPPNSSLGYDSFLQKQDVDLSWIRHAMRDTSLLRDESFVADPRWLAWVIENWIGDRLGKGGQLDYFQCCSLQRERSYRTTTHLSNLALLAGLTGALVLLIGGYRLHAIAQQALVLAMGLLPLLAGLHEAYSYKRADKELIKQFRFMRRLFESCRERLNRSRGETESRQLLLALGRACLEEHAEWILLHRERPLENAQMSG